MHNKLSGAEIHIWLVLPYQTCTMIGPRYEYGKYTGGSIDNSKVPRKPGNLEILEKTISQSMVHNYEQQLAGALTDLSPIVYADCSKKGDKEILFFIMEQLLERQKPTNTDEIVRKVITQSSMLDDDQKNQLKTISGDILPHYYTMFGQLLEKYENDEQKETVKKFEIDVALRIMWKALRDSWKRAYVYIDHIETLPTHEQQQINLLLYSRGAISSDGYLYLKINNGLSTRATRTATNGQRVQSTHDYGETYIKEEELPKA